MTVRTVWNSQPDIVGIDFSGAQNAGDNIWITTGTTTTGTLTVTACNPATDFLNIPPDKELVFEALVDWTDSLSSATIGLDFPFSIPKAIAHSVFDATCYKDLLTSPTWPALTPDQFRHQCTNTSGDQYRLTDAMHRGDHPHSIRVYKQTFHGIRDILKPLHNRNVSIAPMLNTGPTTVLETYPAATLAAEPNLIATHYKNTSSGRDHRQHNIQTLSQLPALNLSNLPQATVINDSEGHALDSLVAALATYRATHQTSPFTRTPYTPIEGHIYS
ncbi:DUF429 domain-containing protein [Halorubellus sp. PRR65]|uniref:DUF429 domain-containing protein n=1 Tax=Halorubellus sp. PRR65 TaxID=3098148 RepID=UPI002B258ABC|nr:DUF429 domain-containing protein [Halorubellus sp. PRR65]